MKNAPLVVKERKDTYELVLRIRKLLDKAVQKRGKKLSWLRYAKRKNSSYIPLRNKHGQYRLLSEVTDELYKINPSFTKGHIADLISELVNTTLGDELKARGLSSKKFLDKLLIETVNDFYIPFHPWYLFQKSLNKYVWLAVDLIGGKKVKIRKLSSGNFVFFKLFLKRKFKHFVS